MLNWIFWKFNLPFVPVCFKGVHIDGFLVTKSTEGFSCGGIGWFFEQTGNHLKLPHSCWFRLIKCWYFCICGDLFTDSDQLLSVKSFWNWLSVKISVCFKQMYNMWSKPHLQSKMFLPVLNVHTGRWCEMPAVITSRLLHTASLQQPCLCSLNAMSCTDGNNAAHFQTVSPQRHSWCHP